MPRYVWESTRAQRDFNHIKADANLIRQRVLRQPQVREHHYLTLLRRRHVHPRCHPASTPPERLYFNHAKRCSIHAKDIQLTANATPRSWADVSINNLDPRCL